MSDLALADVLPDFAAELIRLLNAAGREDLAGQVTELPLLDRCRCSEPFCATLYAIPRPVGSWGEGFENLEIESPNGQIILDIVHGRIAAIEALDRPVLREALIRSLP
jgi:hypothetical protein